MKQPVKCVAGQLYEASRSMNLFLPPRRFIPVSEIGGEWVHLLCLEAHLCLDGYSFVKFFCLQIEKVVLVYEADIEKFPYDLYEAVL